MPHVLPFGQYLDISSCLKIPGTNKEVYRMVLRFEHSNRRETVSFICELVGTQRLIIA